MTLQEYIEFYNKHTGEPFEFKQGFCFFYHPDHGFCEYKLEEEGLFIWQMCGDLKYWIKIAYDLCQRMRIPSITSFVVRHPKPFIRRLGFKIIDTETKGGQHRYHCENDKGETLTATQHGDRYIFVWNIKFEWGE
jgi:hypothetical protein